VFERVPIRARWLVDEEAVTQLAQRPGEVIGVRVQDRAEELDRERPTDHRAGLGHLARPTRHLAEPIEDRRVDRLGDVAWVGYARAGGILLGDGGHELFDVKRDPVRSVVDRLDEVSRWRQLTTQQRGRHRRRVIGRQAGEPRLLREPAV
jgi:hypothetical protein